MLRPVDSAFAAAAPEGFSDQTTAGLPGIVRVAWTTEREFPIAGKYDFRSVSGHRIRTPEAGPVVWEGSFSAGEKTQRGEYVQQPGKPAGSAFGTSGGLALPPEALRPAYEGLFRTIALHRDALETMVSRGENVPPYPRRPGLLRIEFTEKEGVAPPGKKFELPLDRLPPAARAVLEAAQTLHTQTQPLMKPYDNSPNPPWKFPS